MCVNLKELAFFSQMRRRVLQDYSVSPYTILENLPFTLTKFVNDYFNQDGRGLAVFLKSQPMLETLELHPILNLTNLTDISLYFPHLKTLFCPQIFYHRYLTPDTVVIERLRLDCESWGIINHMRYPKNLKSLALFLMQKPDRGANHCHFLPIMHLIRAWVPQIKYLQIYQLLFTVRPLLLSSLPNKQFTYYLMDREISPVQLLSLSF